MSAELLLEAAALMRERAEAATPSPWRAGICRHSDRGDEHRVVSAEGFGQIADFSESWRVEADAAHIASWHPAVALAVADWLEVAADRYEVGFWGKNYQPALAVARAYLGRDS